MAPVVLQVAAGGALGAVARYLAGMAALRLLGGGFPWGTLFVNVAGSFLIGLAMALLEARGTTRATPFLVTGILGGFTTFSAFSLETAALVGRGATGPAALYVLLSVALSLAAVTLGLAAARLAA